eukprot:CAMPEP_0119533326 /NCGR_PEP_ID=MMETSP1344-20130328/46728_1 /TAXON_ID=236787 /ORGANISM="Florenciella parvula, Strain CCMP2471" /LENGTH=85 /DNA_ID=CAMNT_0007574161 /DNA_START=492 /DNA_END=749 /DNA_ORIENTATION=-
MRRACVRRGVEIAHTGRACRVRAMAESQDGRTWRWVIEHGHTDLKLRTRSRRCARTVGSGAMVSGSPLLRPIRWVSRRARAVARW